MKLTLNYYPPQRPIQTTKDLVGFWDKVFGSKKELAGRYPAPWPDNPRLAQATKYTKREPTYLGH